MPSYSKFSKSSALGDTVLYNDKFYKVIPADGGGRTIDLNRPIKVKIDNPVIDKLVNTGDYKALSETKWDMDYPKVTQEMAGTNLDKQNRAALVKTELSSSFEKNTKPALMTSLNMFEAALQNNNITKAELSQIFAPPSSVPAGTNLKGGVAAKFNLSGNKSGGIFDESVYSDINKLRSAINKQGADFFVARTNLKTPDETWQKLNDDYDTGKISLRELNKKLELARVSESESQNYLKQVLNRISTWKAKNGNLSTVQRVLKQYSNYDHDLAMADLNSLNIQDVKNWRIESKNKILDDMFSNLKDDPEMKDAFGTPKFNKQGKLVGYSMEELYNQLDNSFDAAGNFDYNHILKTNYTREYANAKNKLEQKHKELYPEEFKNSGIPFLEKVYEMGSDDSIYENLDAVEAENLGFKTALDIPHVKQRGMDKLIKNAREAGIPRFSTSSGSSELSSVATGMPNYSSQLTYAYAFTPESFSRKLQDRFSEAIYNLYTDRNDRNIINIPTPFFENYGPSGLGAKALVKEINLADTKGDSPYIWQSFLADWKQSQGGLATKINGINRRISFEGAGESGYESAEGEEDYIGETNEKGIKLINNFENWSKKHGTKANSFTMSAYRYANDNRNNSAMSIIFPPSFLKSQLVDEKNKAGYLSTEDYNLLVQNGLTIIGEQGDFNNHLIRSTRSNLQAHVDYSGSYNYSHPSGLASLTIVKDDTGDYDLVLKLKDPVTNKILTTTDYNTRFGDQLDLATLKGMNKIQNYVSKVLSAGYNFETTEEPQPGVNRQEWLTNFGL